MGGGGSPYPKADSLNEMFFFLICVSPEHLWLWGARSLCTQWAPILSKQLPRCSSHLYWVCSVIYVPPNMPMSWMIRAAHSPFSSTWLSPPALNLSRFLGSTIEYFHLWQEEFKGSPDWSYKVTLSEGSNRETKYFCLVLSLWELLV